MGGPGSGKHPQQHSQHPQPHPQRYIQVTPTGLPYPLPQGSFPYGGKGPYPFVPAPAFGFQGGYQGAPFQQIPQPAPSLPTTTTTTSGSPSTTQSQQPTQTTPPPTQQQSSTPPVPPTQEAQIFTNLSICRTYAKTGVCPMPGCIYQHPPLPGSPQPQFNQQPQQFDQYPVINYDYNYLQAYNYAMLQRQRPPQPQIFRGANFLPGSTDPNLPLMYPPYGGPVPYQTNYIPRGASPPHQGYRGQQNQQLPSQPFSQEEGGEQQAAAESETSLDGSSSTEETGGGAEGEGTITLPTQY